MILASALCFASYGVWSRMMGHDFGIFYQGWVRSAIILAILFPVALIGKSIKPVRKAHRKWFLITMIATVFTQAPLYFAFNHLTLGTATFIFYGWFLITTYVIGWLFLGEKITKIKILSFALSLVGIFLTFGLSMAGFSIVAMLLAAFNGIASGAEIATSKKSTDHYSTIHLTAYSWVLILITHLPLSLLTQEQQWIPAFNIEWLAMLGYAISGLLGFWLVIEGFKYVDASIGGLIGLLEIIFAAIFGIIFFQDELTSGVIIGGIVILIAAILPDVYALKHRKAKPVPPPPPFMNPVPNVKTY